MIKELFFTGFPREIGEQRHVVRNYDEAIKWLQENDGYVPCYISIYSFEHTNAQTGRPLYDSAIVDKIYFDLDGLNAQKDAIKLHEYLVNLNIKHFGLMSGNGYHVYVGCIPITRREVDFEVGEALAAYQNYVETLLGIQVCISCKGNLSKVSRLPNTWHPIAHRYCIPIKSFYDDHKQLAIKRQWDIAVFGKELIDLRQYKTKPKSPPKDIPTVSIEGVEFPHCIQLIAQNPNPSFSERIAIVAYLNEYFRLGEPSISEEDENRITIEIVDFLAKLHWKRFTKSATKKYVRWLVRGLNKSFSCNKLEMLGLCNNCGEA